MSDFLGLAHACPTGIFQQASLHPSSESGQTIQRFVRTPLIFLLAGLISMTAMADEPASFSLEQKFDRQYRTIEYVGGRFIGGIVTGQATVLDSTMALMPEGEKFKLECLSLIKLPDEADLRLNSVCGLEDSSGERWVFEGHRTKGNLATLGDNVPGQWKLIGGTGKYRNLRGECSYDMQYIPGFHILHSPGLYTVKISTVKCTLAEE